MAFINYKLIQLLDSFSEKEIDEFGKFISSSFITKGRNYLPLLKHVLDLMEKNKTKSDKIELEPLKDQTNLSDQTLRNRYSELYKLGEEFLIYKWVSENKIEKDMILLKKLHEKNLLTHFKILYKESLKQNNLEKFNLSKLKNLALVYETHSDYLLKKNKEDQIYNEYYERSEFILCYNLISLYEMGIEFFQQEAENRKYDPNYVTQYLELQNIDPLIIKFRKSEKVIYKITAMSYYLYNAFENKNEEENYYISHKIFKEISSELEDNYKTTIFQYMINYCIRKYNDGHENYRFELFDLYNEKLDQHLISDLNSKSYSFNHFRDYVFIGIDLKKFKWVENFIEKYSQYLPVELRNDEINLSYAKLYFAKKDFKRSLEKLTGIKASHYLFYIDTSTYKLFNYYELKQYEDSYPEMEKLKQFIRNNKNIPVIHQKYNLNFIRIYNKLIKYQIEPDKTDVGFLKKDIKNTIELSAKNWLINKVSELD